MIQLNVIINYAEHIQTPDNLISYPTFFNEKLILWFGERPSNHSPVGLGTVVATEHNKFRVQESVADILGLLIQVYNSTDKADKV